MINTKKYLNTEDTEGLLKELKSFKKISDIKFDKPHTIQRIGNAEWLDSGDDQNTCTSIILRIKAGELDFLIYQSYSDYSCDFTYTSSFKIVIDILI